ncbi:MAG: hypothetical protein RIG26_01170 [Thalassospira sp.]|uniref:substrate-binding periplasmic protein n=1 Tax=Thalassospira sp. TaxID=1912094 RepID=UPI0032EFEA0D
MLRTQKNVILKGWRAPLCALLFCGMTSPLQTPANAQTPEPVLTIEYPPFLGSNLENKGIVIALMRDYAKQNMSVDIRAVFMPPARVQKMISDNNWCLTTYPPSKDNVLSRFVALSSQTLSLGLYRVRPRDQRSFEWEHLSDLRGSSVAVLRSYETSPFVTQIIAAGLHPVYVETVAQGFQLMLAGRVDYAYGDNFSVDAIDDVSRQDIEFSKTHIAEANVGFYYNTNCAHRIFKNGTAPEHTRLQPDKGASQ